MGRRKEPRRGRAAAADRRVAAFVGAAWTAALTTGPGAATFVDVAADLGLTGEQRAGSPEKEYIVDAKGGGVAFVDADGDGDPDAFVVEGSGGTGRHALYRNDAGRAFVEVGEALGLASRGGGMGVVGADYDGDGDVDLLVTNLGGNSLYRNDGGTRFVDVAERLGVAGGSWSTGAAFADVDRDGDLDLYVAGYVEFDRARVAPLGSVWQGVSVFVGPGRLPAAADTFYRNDGDSGFAEVTAWARLAHPSPGYGLGVLFGDFDEDGHLDLFVANDSSPNFLYRNRGDGRFLELSLPAGVGRDGAGRVQASMGAAAGDYDADGDPDLFLTHFEGEHNTLYRNRGDGVFEDVSFAAGVAAPSLPLVGFGTAFVDADADGDLDLAVANGHVYPQIDRSGSGSTYAQPNHLYENTGEGGYRPPVPLSDLDRGGYPRVSRGLSVGDYDGDGGPDLLVGNLDDPPSLLRNAGTGGQSWIGVRAIGRRVPDAPGTRVRVSACGRTFVRITRRGGGFLGSDDPRLLVGLGRCGRVDTLEVRWPEGDLSRRTGLKPGRYVTVRQADDVPTD